jgi:hypothetical protein
MSIDEAETAARSLETHMTLLGLRPERYQRDSRAFGSEVPEWRVMSRRRVELSASFPAEGGYELVWHPYTGQRWFDFRGFTEEDDLGRKVLASAAPGPKASKAIIAALDDYLTRVDDEKKPV